MATTDYLTKALRIPDLRNRILFTAAILALYRFMAHIPVPGVDPTALRLMFDSSGILSALNVFSGGGLRNFSIVALGVGPYINASIIIQLLSMVIPQLEELMKEGSFGRQKINQYTQALALPLTLIQAYGFYFLLQHQSLTGVSVLPALNTFQLITVVLTMSAGSFFLIWLGEAITERGIGNGMSMIIFAGIMAGIPGSAAAFFSIADASQLFNVMIFVAVAAAVIAGVVYINEAYRKIEVQYSSQSRGGKNVGGGSSFIPVRINQAGVIPIIFAVSLVLLPSAVAGYLQTVSNAQLVSFGTWLAINFTTRSIWYNALYFVLVFGFTYLYTSITFNPEKIADEIRRGGGFIAGIRPGRSTVEYLKYIISRLTLAGGVFLGLIAILPSVIQSLTNISTLAVGGTGLLIVVSVILQTIKQVESQVVTKEYDSFRN
jgi:preprotein translocase subunit SecY